MKSIVYLTNGERRNIPRLIEHEDWHCPGDAFRRTDQWIQSDSYLGRHYLGHVRGDHTIHQRINKRAEMIGQTAWHIWHSKVLPPGQYGRKWGRDYQWHVSPQRIARSRFRKAKRDIRTGRKSTYGSLGYACMDFSFGLYPDIHSLSNLNDTEREYLQARLELAATSRAPLPPWHLSDCWAENQAA